MLSGRNAWLAWAALVLAPLPLIVALLVTARPDYPQDACYYGPPAESVRATEDYLGMMASLGMFALAAAVTVLSRLRTERWRRVALLFTAWAALTLLWQEASHPVMYPGGMVAIFALYITPPVLVVTVLVATQGSALRAIAWFEALFLLPVLLGTAKVLAQPSCIP